MGRENIQLFANRIAWYVVLIGYNPFYALLISLMECEYHSLWLCGKDNARAIAI